MSAKDGKGGPLDTMIGIGAILVLVVGLICIFVFGPKIGGPSKPASTVAGSK